MIDNYFVIPPEVDDFKATLLERIKWCTPELTRQSAETHVTTICINELAGYVEPFEMYPQIKLEKPNTKWDFISALQKLIRRGENEWAMAVATGLICAGESEYVWRRLNVIALEDIGPANPELALLVYAISGKKKWREETGDITLIRYVVDAMARTVKSRAACELAVWSWFDPLNDELKEKLVYGYDTDNAIHQFLCKTGDPTVRQLNGLALTGSLNIKVEGKKDPLYAVAEKKAVINAVAATDVHPLIKILFDAGVKKAAEGLITATYIQWGFMMEEDVVIKHNSIPATTVINDLPAVTWDGHTHAGKRAAAYYSKSCPEVREWLDKYVPGKNPVTYITAAIFNVEGGCVLKDRLQHISYDQALLESWRAEARGLDVDYHDLMQLYGIVAANLDILNQARARIILGKG